jgi:hypothetical protein
MDVFVEVVTASARISFSGWDIFRPGINGKESVTRSDGSSLDHRVSASASTYIFIYMHAGRLHE